MSKTAALVGILVLLGFFAAVGAMVFIDIPTASKEPLMLLVGALSTMAGSVVGYFYGSSAGSDRKTELLSQPGGGQGGG